MPDHDGMRGKNSLLKKHMMPPVETSRKKEPEPIAPPPSAEKPPVLDASIDEGNGSSDPGSSNEAMDNDTLILIGLGALLLFSYGMVR